MRIWNYNTEKKDPIPTDLYFKFALVGLVLGVALILIGISVQAVFKLVVKYWLWALGMLAAAFVIKRMFFKKKTKPGEVK
jgi:uncharacterized membrane protein